MHLYVFLVVTKRLYRSLCLLVCLLAIPFFELFGLLRCVFFFCACNLSNIFHFEEKRFFDAFLLSVLSLVRPFTDQSICSVRVVVDVDVVVTVLRSKKLSDTIKEQCI